MYTHFISREQREKEEIEKYRMERPKIQQQFSDLKVSRTVTCSSSCPSQQRTEPVGLTDEALLCVLFRGWEKGPAGVCLPKCMCAESIFSLEQVGQMS